MSDTPTYDRLRAKADAAVATSRASGEPISGSTYRLLRELSGKAITSGQRAGERAAHNVYDAYAKKTGDYLNTPAAVRERAKDMARIASARARERYALKLIERGIA